MMPCVFQIDRETGRVLHDSAVPIICFGDQWNGDTPRKRLKNKFDYRKIKRVEVERFADSLGFE